MDKLGNMSWFEVLDPLGTIKSCPIADLCLAGKGEAHHQALLADSFGSMKVSLDD